MRQWILCCSFLLSNAYGQEKSVGGSSAGWALAQTTSATWVTGAELFGDSVLDGLAGVTCPGPGSTELCFPHYRSSERWYTGVALVNLHPTEPARLTLTAYGDNGQCFARASRVLAPCSGGGGMSQSGAGRAG